MRSSLRHRGDIQLSGKSANHDARRDLFIDLGVARWPLGSWAILGSPRAPKIAPPTQLLYSIDSPWSVGTRRYAVRRNVRRSCGAAPGASMLSGKNGGKHPKSPLSAAVHAAGPLPIPGLERTKLKEPTTQKISFKTHKMCV